MKPLAVLILCLVLALSAHGSSKAAPPDDPYIFSKVAIPLWQERIFQGHTNYAFIQEDDALVLKAHCKGTASAFYRRMEVDLTKTPILRWSWKVDNIHAGLDDVSKAGDDYAARVYVVYKGKMPWDISALDYVWANVKTVGSSWPNAFTKRAVMIAQESGAPEHKDIWIDESRDVSQDFKRYFGMDVAWIDGVAVMTDCDNGGGTATSYYRNIRFTPAE